MKLNALNRGNLILLNIFIRKHERMKINEMGKWRRREGGEERGRTGKKKEENVKEEAKEKEEEDMTAPSQLNVKPQTRSLFVSVPFA